MLMKNYLFLALLMAFAFPSRAAVEGHPGQDGRTYLPQERIEPESIELPAAFFAGIGLGSAALPGTAAADGPQAVRAELKQDRVSIFAGGRLFTEYLFLEENKYPYFFPVNGPATGKSVTIHQTEPYPHHSSLFFGCDRVNGGNFWQEGLERGRIVSKRIVVRESSGARVIIEQDCRWERPGAEPPFADQRVIVISAPSSRARCIDVEITLVALMDVRIEKTNHSLFAARTAPELSVKGGGVLMNAHGDRGENGTFGKPAPWAHSFGARDEKMEGIAIFSHPSNPWSPPRWFTRDYGFFSPTPMNWLEAGGLEIAKGEKLQLRYRVLIHAGALGKEEIQQAFEDWAGDGAER